jgi:serine/threonine protein kinase
VFCGTFRPVATNRVHEVAIKRVASGATQTQVVGFFNEIRTLALLNHPNIIKLHGAVTQTDPILLVTEFCTNGDLSAYVKRGTGPMPLERWSADMVRAVMCLHRFEVVHRDLACRNFLLDNTMTAKLCDLGMAKETNHIANYYQRQRVEIAVRWAAPESLTRGLFSAGTDTWSLAVTLCELYSGGEVPYAHIADPRQVFEQILLRARTRIPPEMPSRLADAIDALWSHADATGATVSILGDAVGVTSDRLPGDGGAQLVEVIEHRV